jgi:site-specific DNA recombinase
MTAIRRTSANLPTPPRRVAGYIRISALMGREQGEDLLSDVIQREKIEAWANYRGCRVVHWYIDLDVSGRKGVRRPEFERMMADAAEGKFETIAVYRLTRFARSVKDASAAVDVLERAGVTLVSVTEDIDTGTVAGNLLRNILFALSEFESERIGEEWRNFHANQRRQGHAHVPSGAYGYRIVKDDGTRTARIVGIEDAQAPALRLMFDMRASGATYGDIRNALHAHGHRSPRGHEWWAKPTILAMLRNPIYAGMVRLADGDLIDASHPAIVTREQWERVQAMAGHANGIARGRSNALLVGLLVCHSCGYRMRYDSTQRRYRCQVDNAAVRCAQPVQIAAHLVEPHVEGRFLRRFDPKRMPHDGRMKRTQQQKVWQRKADKARNRIAELDRALDTLADQRFMKGTLAEDEYHRQFARYSAEREDRREEAEEFERLVKTVRPLERSVLDLWSTATIEAKRKALRLQIHEIVVKPSTAQRGRETERTIGSRLAIGWFT